MTDLPRLSRLGEQVGTDKLAHGYLEVYERYLEPWRGREVILLEIGAYRGASLVMWQRYFPKGWIYGIDSDPDCAKLSLDRTFDVFIGSQDDPEFLRRVTGWIGQPDIVIDDGSHLVAHQLVSFEVLFPLLRPGGFYFVEDVHWGWGDKPDEGNYWNFGRYAQGWTAELNIRSKNKGNIWSGDKRRQLRGDLTGLTDLEKSLKSVSFYKSLVAIEKENWA